MTTFCELSGVINILGKLILRDIRLDLVQLKKKIKAEFSRMKHESEEYLQAINENTNEIAANYEYICEIEKKLDRLTERVDTIQMHLEADIGVQISNKKEFDVKRLTRREQEVFLVIYTLEDEKVGITYSDIAKRIGISEELAGNYVTSIIEKGVPVMKRYVNLKPHIRLDSDFKTLQAKENILQVSLQEFGF